MRVFLSPQVNDKKIDYQFNGDVIIASYNGQSDTFDFSSMPDGVLTNVETILPINPIIEAKRIEGELSVKLLNFIDGNATDEEKYPTWQVIDNGKD